ncbi:MAG: hypothetical protein JNJ77_10050 [Planctomycetia bacterium]|nr:hypothetical protein [Planctomycetia bacterium]
MNKIGTQIINGYAKFFLALFLIQVAGLSFIKVYFKANEMSWLMILLMSAAMPFFGFVFVNLVWGTVDNKNR